MTHGALNKLIQKGAGENEIQKLMKGNLNLLGEACTPSSIAGEYIAFSEYPIITGKTDFVVFTDRSRMVVVIIEVKGADFNFLNSDNSVNANINEAARQVRERFRVIESNYELFRRGFHEIRRDVESGKAIYNSYLGPNKPLQVDPNKEVWLKGMVIGGRVTDEYLVSKERHSLEKESPRLSFDTWDSWTKNNGEYGDTLRLHNV
ncbi:Shedu anti-phage system protein SduA domain-containing protein [Xanthomonas sp. NCPPB 3443]|uniref:Shedu anti-phage system protein SduA domain-containing protein n=1 Tax=Xanthomonas TaxID=338 RepID=UPI003558F2EE